MSPRKPISCLIIRALGTASPRTTFICPRCQRNVQTAARKANLGSQCRLSSRRNASSFLDPKKWQKRIWGTDVPPGQADPYGPAGEVERRNKEIELERDPTGKTQVEASAPPLEGDEYEEFEVKATTWDGLDVVGYRNWGREQWDEQYPFQGYMNPSMESASQVSTCIHRALVEVMTLKQAGLPLVMASEIEDPETDEVGGFAYNLAKGATFERDDGGGLRLVLPDERLQQAILESISPMNEKEDVLEEEVESEEAEQEELEEGRSSPESESFQGPTQSEATQDNQSYDMTNEKDGISTADVYPETLDSVEELGVLEPVDDSWRNVSLEDQDFKFAVLKRVMQLIGRRIPDPAIQRITDTEALHASLIKKPKPKKLAESLFANEIAQLPNVEIREKRYSPIDKEVEVGRWKVIERELKARGLPVTGNDSLGAAVRNP